MPFSSPVHIVRHAQHPDRATHLARFAPALLVAALLSASPAPAAAAAAGDAAGNPLRALNEHLVSVFEKVAPAVVVIEVEKKQQEADDDESAPSPFDFFFRDPQSSPQTPPGRPDRRFRMPPQGPQSEGSGFIARADGHIFTNRHVIDDAAKISVKLRDGRQFPAKVIGSDDKTDIAVLKIDAKDLPVAELGDSDAAKVGQIVCAIGTPFNLDYTFTLGVISAKGRTNLQPDIVYEEYIQTDASINPGNSGGPLLDIDGRVLGMNTLINGINRGLGFAIPASMLREVGDALIRDGKVTRSWLGIRIETLSDRSELREHFRGIDHGVVVQTIEPETPAYKSDLRPADVITKIDGTAVATSRELQKQVLTKRVGQKVELEVWRAGQTKNVTITTGQLPDTLARGEPRGPGRNDAPEAPGATPDPLAAWGVQLQDVTPELARSLDLGGAGGVVVTDVAESGPAAVAGLQARDVITEINGKPVADTAAVRKALETADPARGALLLVDRQGEKTYAVLKLPK
jgi:serine protease Do